MLREPIRRFHQVAIGRTVWSAKPLERFEKSAAWEMADCQVQAKVLAGYADLWEELVEKIDAEEAVAGRPTPP